MTKPQARLFDMHMCDIPAPPTPAGPAPPAPPPIMMICSPNVMVGGLPAARVSDMHTSLAGPHPVVTGSMTVMINYLQAARIGDLGVCGGAIMNGEFTVLTGG
ncbi:MAG: PAAR domain-containing protein [Jhaorihella sp.]